MLARARTAVQADPNTYMGLLGGSTPPVLNSRAERVRLLAVVVLAVLLLATTAAAEYASPYDGARVPCDNTVRPVGYDNPGTPGTNTPLPLGAAIDNVVMVLDFPPGTWNGDAWLADGSHLYGEVHAMFPVSAGWQRGTGTLGWAGRLTVQGFPILYTVCQSVGDAGTMTIYVGVHYTP